MASGCDGPICSIGFLVGWPVITFLLAERLRNRGKFTFAGVPGQRFMVMAPFGFSAEALFAKGVEVKKAIAQAAGKSPEQAAAIGGSIVEPGSFVKDPISAISVGMALMVGAAGASGH